MSDDFKKLRDVLAAKHPGRVGPVTEFMTRPVVSVTTRPTAELLYFDARAKFLDAATAVAEFLGTDDAARIGDDLAEHSRLGVTAAAATLADALADLYRANDEWQRAQVRRFAPEQLDPDDE